LEGIFLGIVVGIPSAFVFLLLMRTVMKVRRTGGSDQETRWLIAQFLALPTFMLGGPWFATDLVQFFDWERTKLAYTATVGSIFGAVGFVFLVIFAVQTGSEMWHEGTRRA
jgi:hypothetical protein